MTTDEQTPNPEATEVATAVEATPAPTEVAPESTPEVAPETVPDSTITEAVHDGSPLATASDVTELTPDAPAPEINPATGENPEVRLENGIEGGEAPAVEPTPEPVADLTLSQLLFREARMVLPDLQSWASTNAVKVIHDEYQQHIQLIHATGLELPPFIANLLESQTPHA